MKFPTTGLYAITQTTNKSNFEIISNVEAALEGGAVVIQYRDKRPNKTAKLATELLTLCRQKAVPLIINDDVKLAKEIAADGVHLGKNDANTIQAREYLGKQYIIGVSCYNSVENALIAEKKGVTYVAFGRFFPSASKPLAAAADISILPEAKKILNIPIVAIGGILPSNGGELITAGADLLAVIGGVFDQEPKQSAQNYQFLFGR